jgi:hypothetical protein
MLNRLAKIKSVPGILIDSLCWLIVISPIILILYFFLLSYRTSGIDVSPEEANAKTWNVRDIPGSATQVRFHSSYQGTKINAWMPELEFLKWAKSYSWKLEKVSSKSQGAMDVLDKNLDSEWVLCSMKDGFFETNL